MNYTVDISSDQSDLKKAVKKISQSYKDTYSKQEVASNVKEILKALNLDGVNVSNNDDKNIVFSLLKGTTPKATVTATPYSKTEKVVVKFAEHKYFKNLKYLFGTYKTELTQAEGSSELTRDAYIRGILGTNFHATDLTSTDKFVKIEEIDLRSPYFEALNNVLFQSTRSMEGEIYGVTEDCNLFVSGKRLKPYQRLYDYSLLSTLDDISPAFVVNNIVSKDPHYTSEVDFDYENLERPKYINVQVKESLNSSYNAKDEPTFKYYKNLLIFEAKVDLNSPRLAEKSDMDEGEFQLVTGALQPGDKIEAAIALDGSGTKTHTIITDYKGQCKHLAVSGSDLVAVMSDNKLYTASNVNFEAINHLELTDSGTSFTIDGAQLVDMIFDENENTWVGTFGFEASQGEDFYGDKYYKFMVSKSLTSFAQSGSSGSYMYSTVFSGDDDAVALTFKDKDTDNKIKIADSKSVKIVDNYGLTFGAPSTSLVNPKDIAINSYEESDVTDGADNANAEVGPIVKVDDKEILQKITEGPYVVDPEQYEDDGSKMYQKIFTDGDVDIVLQQDYMFVKNQLYTVDDDGNYTRDMTRSKHWLAAKVPTILDMTMMKLRAMTVEGETSCYNYVKDDIATFCSWALDTAMVAETGGTPKDNDDPVYTFTYLSLTDKFSKNELDNFKESIEPLSKHFTGKAAEGRGLLTYAQFLSMGMSFYSNGTLVENQSTDTYSVNENAIDKIVIDTALPLTSDLEVDSKSRYQMECTVKNGCIISAKAFKNVVNWEEAYRQYLMYALTYVRGIRQYECFGANAVTEIYSFGSKIYFRCYTGDIFFIEKKYLHKASDIESVENWRTSIMPAFTYLNGWDVNDLASIGGYEVVTLKGGKKLPVNNKERRIYFFKTTSKMYTMSDNRHIFFGGYAFPAKDIYTKYKNMGGGEFDTTQDWWKINVSNWVSTDDASGKTPIVLYSNDAGATFNILPVKDYLPDSVFTDGKNRAVQYFGETPDGSIAGYVSENDVAFNSNQIVINIDDTTGLVDTTATKWKQVGIPSDGEVREFFTDEGKIRYTTGRVGFGVDIDMSQMNGSNTFNFDYTGNTAIVIPDGLMVNRIDSGNAIKFNKAITNDSSVSGTYRVLFAAYTKTDIPFQEKYLSSNSSVLADYIKKNGNLKVSSIVRVQNSMTANRMYTSGFPTIEEDTQKIYYEYKNDTVVPLKNSYTNKVIQCSEDGEKFVYSVGTDDNRFIDFASSLGNGVNESQLVAAGKPAHSLDDFLTKAAYMKDEETLTSLLKGEKTYVQLAGYNQDGLIADVTTNTTLAAVLESYGIEKASEGTATGETDYSSFIERIEDFWGGPDNGYENAAARFEYKKAGEKDYLFDKKYNVFVLKQKYYITGTLSLPYTFYNGGNGVTVVPDPIIEYSATTGNMIGVGGLCNGIYYHPMGYGGLRNNNSLTSTTPWLRDPAAFSDGYLKNAVNDYVFLTDNTGSRIRVYDACQLIDEGTYEVTYDSFLNDGDNKITNAAGATITKFYKLKRTDIHQCHTCDYVKSGSKVGLRFYKNTTRITDITLVEPYLFNNAGEKCYNASLSGNMLVVGDPLDAAGKTLTAKFKVSYKIKDKDFAEEVTSTFTLSGNNSTVWADEISDDEDTIIYYKELGLISGTDSYSSTKSESYSFKLTDVNGVFNTEGADIKANNVTYEIRDGVFTVSFAAGSENLERTLTVNGSQVWRAPVICIEDEIKRAKTSDTEYVDYLGDDEVAEGISVPASEVGTPLENTTVLYLGYEQTYTASNGDIIIGSYGYSISRKPKYDTFKNLLFNEGTIIEKSVFYAEDKLTTVKVSSTADDNSEIKLNRPFTFTNKYNDDKEHYFRFKILTVAEQELAPKHMNNPDFYYELSKEQMSQFTPNRVWYNPKGSPVPPIQVGTKIFNSENNYAYYSSDYKNNNGIRIFLCNEAGKYINYDESGEAYILDDGTGDCSKNVYIGVDNRYVSPEPINKTCQDWFYENMYTPNAEVNPLWQVIRIAPKIENKKWVQNIQLCRYKKSGASQLLTNDIDYPYITINSLSQINAEDGSLKVENDFNSFNLEKGKISLLLSEGSDYYNQLIKNGEDMTLYGLNFKVENIKDMYNETEYDMASTLQASYSVNTLRDFTTPVQGDSAIAKVTELGVFDKNHKLIAYAQFPPIEYRTDCQHASFTAVIYHGNMTESE